MFVAVVLAFGVLVNILLGVARRRKWCEFRPQTYSKIMVGDDVGSGAVGDDETPRTLSEIQMTSQDGGQCYDDDSFLENSNGVMS